MQCYIITMGRKKDSDLPSVLIVTLHALFFLFLDFSACASAPKSLDPALYPALLPDENDAAHAAFFTSHHGTMPSPSGGTLRYRIFIPEAKNAEEESRNPVIFIGHGFLRSISAMQGWGEYLASAGYTVVIPTFIHSSLLNGNHAKNALDLNALAEKLAPDRQRIYGGFSAGGLAAALAAAGDDQTVALIGLDAVDSGGLAAPALNRLAQKKLPALFLVADPSACNAQNNLLPVLRERGQEAGWRIVILPGTTHGVYEIPYDQRTELFCGRFADKAMVLRAQARIKKEVTDFLSTLPG